MPRIVLATFVFAVATGAALAQAPNLSRMDIVLKAVPDGPVAVVNGQPISAAVFRNLYQGEMIRYARMNNTTNVPDDDRLGIAMNSLRVLVEREVLYQEGLRRKISVSDAELAEKWKTEFESLKKSIAKPGEELTEAQVLERANTTREEALSELRKAMIVDKVREAIIQEKGVTVSDQEVNEWYEKNKELTRRPDMLRLKQIYFKADATRRDRQNSAAKQKAIDAYNRIKSGQNFEAVCRAVSEGQYKDNGGEWPLLPADKFPPFIRDAANKLKPGEISEPIESDAGYHILKLVEVIPGQEGTLENAAPRIREALLAQKGIRVLSEFCSSVTGDPSKVRVYLDLEKELALRPDLMQRLTKEMGSLTRPTPTSANEKQ